MEKQLRCVLMLSLKEMALRRVAVILYNESDVLALIGKFQFECDMFSKIKWHKTVECKVLDKLSKLQLPDSIMKQIIHIIKPIGSHILRWKLFHESFLSDSGKELDVRILEKLCCTAAGTVDYRKTAEALVSSEVVDIVKRYQLACLYCLEDYIPLFWKELPEEKKLGFFNEDDTTYIETPQLWFCWPYILKGKQYKLDCLSRSSGNLDTFRQYAFEYSAIRGNQAAVEYFLQQLTPEEREPSLVRAALGIAANGSLEMYNYPDDFPKEKVSDVLFYLLSLITSEQQMQIFKEMPCMFLKFFLHWPWQDFFLDNADVMWTLLPESSYNFQLCRMTRNIQNSDLQELFEDFFLRCPMTFKKHFVDEECQLGSFFRQYFNSKDKEVIKVVLRNVEAADRVRLVTSEHAFKLYHKFLHNGAWNIVEECLREAALSKEDKETLKVDFMGFLRRTDRGQIQRRKRDWRRFFEFLDETGAREFGQGEVPMMRH